MACFVLILPNTHSTAYPKVALVVSDDTAYLFALEGFCVREWFGLSALSVVQVETFFCSYDDIAVVTDADAVGLVIFQDYSCAVIVETVGLGVQARYAVGGAYPEVSCVVECHAAYPVIAEMSFPASLLHIEYLDLFGSHIIYI